MNRQYLFFDRNLTGYLFHISGSYDTYNEIVKFMRLMDIDYHNPLLLDHKSMAYLISNELDALNFRGYLQANGWQEVIGVI